MGLLLIFPDNATSLFDFAAKHDNKPYFADIFDEASILETLNEIVESKNNLGERKFNKSEVQQYNRYVQYKKFLNLIKEKPGKDEATPSAVVSKTIKAYNGDEFKIAIPGKELFRLKNIFIDNEYALPDGFGFPENPVIIDVGANVGSFALYASTWSNNCKIHCFEPNPQVLPLLEKNIKPVDAVVHPVALSSKDEVLQLWQHPDSTGGASVTKSSDRGNLVEVSAFNALPYLSNIGVEKIDVLKIDTEGSEIDILRSLEEILPKVRLIMLEYHSEEDRVEIESMLTEFDLVDEIIARKHLGTLKFLNPKLPLSF
jgi:FkbM family methyltransferase